MFRMTNAGVDNVWLADGYKSGQDKFGPYYSIDDIPGLYRAIAIALVCGGPALNNRELRLIRRQLDLTQAELGWRLGRTEQTVLLWERNGKIPADAARQIKLMVLAHLAPDTPIAEAFRIVERARPGKMVFTHRTGTWKPVGEETTGAVSEVTISRDVLNQEFIKQMYAGSLRKETRQLHVLTVSTKATETSKAQFICERKPGGAAEAAHWAGAHPSWHGTARKETWQ